MSGHNLYCAFMALDYIDGIVSFSWNIHHLRNINLHKLVYCVDC